ncbi:TPA: hypothetical protein JLR89_005245 [Escherichia coli]|nr:hypothetical protein [Escherichia coli]
MPESYTPDWFFTALLDHHIDQMMARYSCLRALRMDFFYRKETPDFLQPDHRWLELQLRMLLEQVERFENMVGFFWVIEWTADHGFHAHVVFWIDRQRVKKYIPLRNGLRNAGGLLRITVVRRTAVHTSRIMHTTSTFPCATTILQASIIFAVHCIIWRKKSKKTGCVLTAAAKFLNVLLQGGHASFTSEA